MNENDAISTPRTAPWSMRWLLGGVDRLEQAVGVERQQRQDDAEAEQVDEDHQEDDEQRLAAGTRFRVGAAGAVVTACALVVSSSDITAFLAFRITGRAGLPAGAS